MKDRLEFRFTVATGKVEGRSAKQIAKVAEPYLKRITEALVKVVESHADKEVARDERTIDDLHR